MENQSTFNLKIYYDSTVNKLAILNARPDCSLFITVTDMMAGTTEIIETGLYIEDNKLSHINNNLAMHGRVYDPAVYVSRPFNIEPELNKYFSWHKDFEHIAVLSDEVKPLSIAYAIPSFEADFINNRFLLETPLQETTIKNDTLNATDERLILIYNATDEITQRRKSLNNFFPERWWQNVSFFLNDSVVAYFENTAQSDYLYVVGNNNDATLKVKLYDRDLSGNEKYYEYIEAPSFKKENNLIAYICQAPEGGFTGFRILKLHAKNWSLQPVSGVDKRDSSPLNFEDQEHTREVYVFRAIAINTSGTLAAVLHSTHIVKDYVSTGIYDIYIYDIRLKDAPPLIIHTGQKYEHCPEQIHFITPEIVVVVFADMFSFYNVSTLTLIKNVPYEMLEHYHVSENYIFYIDRNTTYAIFIDGNGNVTKLNIA
jgi:hypothetical protein